MRVIELDCSGWSSPDDFYAALLPELGAPAWHGANLDALYDSLSGGMNRLEPPFRVRVRGGENLSPEMAAFLARASALFREAREGFGIDVSLTIC